MLTLDKAKAKEILVKELGYEDGHADLFLSSYPEIHDGLAEAVKKWFEDRSVTDISYGGLSLAEFMRMNHYNFLVAIMEFNSFFDPNLSEEKKKKLLEILQKPHVRQ